MVTCSPAYSWAKATASSWLSAITTNPWSVSALSQDVPRSSRSRRRSIAVSTRSASSGSVVARPVSRSMLCLTEQVDRTSLGRRCGRRARITARAGRQVDGTSTEDVKLGRGHPGVARPDDLVHPVDGLGAVCEPPPLGHRPWRTTRRPRAGSPPPAAPGTWPRRGRPGWRRRPHRHRRSERAPPSSAG